MWGRRSCLLLWWCCISLFGMSLRTTNTDIHPLGPLRKLLQNRWSDWSIIEVDLLRAESQEVLCETLNLGSSVKWVTGNCGVSNCSGYKRAFKTKIENTHSQAQPSQNQDDFRNLWKRSTIYCRTTRGSRYIASIFQHAQQLTRDRPIWLCHNP